MSGSVCLPLGAVRWSAVSDCDISCILTGILSFSWVMQNIKLPHSDSSNLIYSINLYKMTTVQKTNNCFSRLGITLMHVKELWNTPMGAFCNSFDLH